MQNAYDGETVHAYGQAESQFGGMYFDGDVLVALFADALDHHLNRLTPSLRAPDQFRIEHATRAYADVEAAKERVARKLFGDAGPIREVNQVGITMRGGQFVVMVGAPNPTKQLAHQIREAVAPDEVVVEHAGQMYAL